MSYLDVLRFHFTGRFFTDVSTINNDPAHYSKDFEREVSWEQGGDGWWNPMGGNRFRFEDVTVTSAVDSDGKPIAAASDPILRLSVQSIGRPDGKLVDLDPDQQMVSMIFGLKLGLIDDDTGALFFEGEVIPVAFSDIWRRDAREGSPNDEAACAYYQSQIKVSKWGDLSSSPFLQALRQRTADDLLSIKFSVDGFSMDYTRPATFCRGRVTGTIGWSSAQESVHWIPGRQFGTRNFPSVTIAMNYPGVPGVNGVNHFVGRFDRQRRKVLLDLGNALEGAAGGPPKDVGPQILGVLDGARFVQLGRIEYLAPRWLENTAGIVELPSDRSLTSAEAALIESAPLAIARPDGSNFQVVSEEQQDYVRADSFVIRIDPGDTARVEFRCTRRGQPLPNARIVFEVLPLASAKPPPTQPLGLPSSIAADANGIAVLSLTPSDPGNPRFFYASGEVRVEVDGQIYKVGYRLDGQSYINRSNYLSILVWNTFRPDEPPTWEGSMRPVFKQYADLYPFMSQRMGPRNVDLAVFEQVANARVPILKTLQLAPNDPALMPVVRDLSKSRREAMVRWLTELGPDGLPRRGVPHPGSAPSALKAESSRFASDPRIREALEREKREGGKSVAAARIELGRTLYKGEK